MSWVYYADRKPTEADADCDGDVLVAMKNGGSFWFRSWDKFDDEWIAWLDPKLLPPLPPRKIWRTPTQADLDKATEPIPCRVRDNTKEDWCQSRLRGILRFGERKFYTGCTWRFCEIEVDA